jgi:valacyclovir hydrolase
MLHRAGLRASRTLDRLGPRGLCTSIPGTSGTVAVRGVNLFYRANGSAGLPLLCIPGALGTSDTDYGPQLRDLSDAFQVVSFDPRGCGQSRPPARDFPLDFYQQDADDGAALMEALGHSRYAVMGWSDGAIAGVMLAAAHAHAVDRLVIFGGNAYMVADDIAAFEATRDAKNSWSAKTYSARAGVYGEVEVQRMWDRAIDAWAAIYKHGRFERDGDIRDGGDVCMAQARSVRCPTMVLHGAKDPFCLPHHPAWFKANIPGAADVPMHVLPEGKHNIHQRHAEWVNGLVREFAGGVSSST